MTFSRLNAVATLVASSVFSLYGQNIPPNTGAVRDTPSTDANWYITTNTVVDPGQTTPYVENEAIIVTNPPSGWAQPLPGTVWVAPAANQNNSGTNLPSTCCQGSSTYHTYFGFTAPTAFTIYFYADDSATVLVNGKVVYTGGSTPLYANVVTVSVTAAMLVSGPNNKIDFVVSNSSGGPTGLDAQFVAGIGSTTPPTSTLGLSTAPTEGAHPASAEPVDASSGQYYGTDSDIELGGPMNLGFRRYYSSQLSAGGVATALGTNWMSSFDERAAVSGTNAQVLLFGGKIVSFTLSGGVWQLAAPKDIFYQFIQSGTNYQFLDPDRSWIYTFTSAGALTSIADRNGNTVTITQGANGPTLISDGLGRTLTLAYASGQLASVTDQAARTASFTYSSGVLSSIVDIYQQTTTYAYTTAGTATALQVHKQLPLGNIPLENTYDSQSRVLTQRIVPGNNGNAYTTTIAYNGTGSTSVTDAFGNVTKYGSSGDGNVTQLTDPSGATTTVTYDSSDRRTSFTDRVGNTTNFTYDLASGRLASLIDAAGNTTSLTYLPQPQGGFIFYPLVEVSYPDGTSKTGTFDSKGNRLTATDKNGKVTAYVYDTLGRPVSISNSNQQTTSLTWNPDGTLASATDALGNKRTFAYDSTKRMSSTSGPNNDTTGYVRDKSVTGPMLAIVYPGAIESTTIDDDGNREIARTVNSTGGVFTSDYTATGQLADFTDPLQNKTSYTYDGDDRLSSVTLPAGDVYTYAWDGVNRVTSISDANGPRTAYTYTAESKIATAADGSGRKAAFTYDAMGRLATITTPGGNTYKRGYDKFGRVLTRTDPLGQAETRTRDANGALLSTTLPGSITTALVRDALGRITSVTSPNGNTWKIGRDALERPTQYTDPLGNTTTLSFTRAQLTGATLPLGTVALTNNADGRIIQHKYSDGTTINRAYDSNRMLISADGVTITRDVAGHPANINGIGIALDADHRPGTLTYASGKTVAYAYDNGGRLTSVTDWVGGKTTMAYDGAGRMTSLTYPNGVVTTYTYDQDGHVIGIATGGLSSITLTRDASGKITSANRNVPVTAGLAASSQRYSYDAAGQLTLATSDAMGRVTSQNGRTYKWNLASQLTSFTDGANSGTFTYDGLGEMISSTASGAAQSYVYNYLFPLPALSIVRQGSSDLRYYVYFPNGTLLYSIEAAGNARHFYHFDEMGNTVLLTGDNGALTDSYSITPYGEIADHIGTSANPFTWQGQVGVIQEGMGLFYSRSRHYDASVARFISRDPKPSYDPRASEPYAYAAGNPLRFIDPRGTDYNSDIADVQYEESWYEFDDLGNYYQDTNAQLYGLPTQESSPSADWQDFANDIENALDTATFVDSQDYLNAEDLYYAVIDAPDLDWQGWLQNLANLNIFIPGLAAYQVPASTYAPVSPLVPQTSGPALGGLHCPPLVCAGAAGSSVGLATGGSGLITQDGGGLITQDGGGLITQDGGGLITQDGGGLITQDGGGLITQDGGGLITQDGGGLLPNQ